MVNGKYNNLKGMQFDEATITTANKFGKNGLLQLISKAIPALPSIWEFVQLDPLMPRLIKRAFCFRKRTMKALTPFSKTCTTSAMKNNLLFSLSPTPAG